LTANQLTKQVIKYCVQNGHYVFRINNAPTQRRKGTIHKGVADIMGCTKKGRVLAIEIKTTDKQSDEQKEFQKQFEQRNGIYILCKKLEDVTDIL